MNIIDPSIIKDYQATRSCKSDCLCYYPNTSLYFKSNGDIVVCCYSEHAIGKWPKDKLADVWNNAKIQHIRKSVCASSLNLNGNCHRCQSLLKQKFFGDSLLMKGKDWLHQYVDQTEIKTNIIDHPLELNFELSNMCNYECITCGGNWSSSIRKNREGLPALINPYTPEFCEELKPFYSKLKIGNFLGGEPFLSPLYPIIWEDMIKLNPSIIIHATTNGSILTDRIKKILEYENFKLTASIEGVTKQTYEMIRKNGNFEKVMANVNTWIDQKKLHGIAMCPIIQNCDEVPNMLMFCEEKNVVSYFNYVSEPLGGRIKGIHEHGNQPNFGKVSGTLIPEFCLDYLPKDKLEKLVSRYSRFLPALTESRLDCLRSLIDLLSIYIRDYDLPHARQNIAVA